MTRKAFGLAGMAAVLLAAPAFAHHSFAMFDQSKVLYKSGTVQQFEFVNPHAWLHLAIMDDKGELSTWSFEGGSVVQLVRLGWSKDGFQARRRGRDRLPPHEGRLARRPDHERASPPTATRSAPNRGCGDGSGDVLAARIAEASLQSKRPSGGKRMVWS